MYCVNTKGEVFYRNGVEGDWRKLDGQLQYVSVSADGKHVWGCNGDKLFYRRGADGAWRGDKGGFEFGSVTVSGDGSLLFATATDGTVYWRYANDDWRRTDGKLKVVALTPDGSRAFGATPDKDVAVIEFAAVHRYWG